MVTEFGYSPVGAGYIFDEDAYFGYTAPGDYGRDITEYLASKNIGWIAWSFSEDWQPALLTDETNYNPSAAGIFFKDQLNN